MRSKALAVLGLGEGDLRLEAKTGSCDGGEGQDESGPRALQWQFSILTIRYFAYLMTERDGR